MLNAVYTHWCYQCSEQFGPVEGEPVCPYCYGGFVEQLSTVQDSTLPNSEDDSTQQMPDLFDLNALMRSPDLFDLNALMRSPDLRFEIMDVVDAFMSWRVPGRNPNFDVRGRSGLVPDQNRSVVGPRICGQCNEPTTTGASEFLGHHGVSALARDLFHPEINSQVPEGLSNHVVSSKRAQANWYIKLLEAWRAAQPPPETPEEAARLVIETLKTNQKADVEGLLAFYGLPLPHTLVQLTAGPPTSLPAGVDARAIADGDGFTVYVNTTDPRESSCVPIDVQVAAVQRSEVCAEKNYSTADAIHDIIINSGYRVIKFQNSEEILARKYRIRLRGIDAPENSMPYGQEAKEELTKIVQGKCLRVLVYGEDQYGRCISDLYCNGKFVQELMLKKGLVWHYAVYDQRPELATWEKEARARRVGLWASSNPEKPWEWRKNNPR